jgi:uncharacterized protein (TIGR03435 family)
MAQCRIEAAEMSQDLRGLARSTIIVSAACCRLAAQAQEPITRPEVGFEVASVKQNRSTLGPSQFGVPARGNLSALGVPTLWLIAYAWDIAHLSRIKGNPGWLLSDYYDVRAIPPEQVPRDQIPLMMQSLLMDRFKLRAHWEMRDQPIYSLELAREDGTFGPDLKPSKHDCAAFVARGGKTGDPDVPRDEKGRLICTGSGVFGQLFFGDAPWSEIFPVLALEAESIGGLDRPVVDNTGLSGNFDIHLEFAPGGRWTTLATLAERPLVREAIREQLGLRLVPKTMPSKVLVIDAIERPTPD